MGLFTDFLKKTFKKYIALVRNMPNIWYDQRIDKPNSVVRSGPSHISESGHRLVWGSGGKPKKPRKFRPVPLRISRIPHGWTGLNPNLHGEKPGFNRSIYGTSLEDELSKKNPMKFDLKFWKREASNEHRLQRQVTPAKDVSLPYSKDREVAVVARRALDRVTLHVSN